MRKFTQKSYETGGVRVGGATNYTDIGTDGALTDAGTQSHNLNELTVTTLAATTNSLTNITATAACATSIPRAGSYTNYISVGTDGAITDTGTQMHALANVHITSLSVGTAASSSGTAQIGGGSNYLGVDADGALTDTGTQMHALNNVHVTTLSVGTAASSSGTMQVGGVSNYASIGSDGAITDTGTQTHDLATVNINAGRITTLTAESATWIGASATNYLSVGADGALGDTGTQSHDLNAVRINALTAAGVTWLGASGSNYIAVGADGAITDAGTQAHDLNNVHVTTLSVGTAASSAGTAQIGGGSNYLSVSADGALSDTGTQSHSLNDVTITTLTATNIATQTRYLDLPVCRWTTNSGASCTTTTPNTSVGSGSTNVLRFVTAASVPGDADLSAIASFRAPSDWLAANAASVKLITSHTSTGASNVVWTVTASAFGDLEAAAGTVVTATKVDATSGETADALHTVDVGELSAAGIAAEDLVLLKLDFTATSASHFRLESDVWNVRVAYKANTLA